MGNRVNARSNIPVIEWKTASEAVSLV